MRLRTAELALPASLPLLLGIAIITLSSCRQESSSLESSSAQDLPTLTQQQEDFVAQEGTTASLALMKMLGAQLKPALAAGGPENALHVCQSIAQPLTAQASVSQPDLSVTRTALRYRNPVNKPDAQARLVLAEWETLLSQGKELPANHIIPVEGNQALFFKPILTEAMCLKCHGDPATFSPALATKLRQAYPQDQATNFEEGDLRGAFRVLVTLP